MRWQKKIQPTIIPIPVLRSRQNFFAAVLIALLGITATGAAYAETYRSRADSWEFTVQIPYADSQSTTSDNGSKIDTNGDVGFGFGFGYNYTDKLALIFDINWASPTYNATLISADVPPAAPRKANGEMSASVTQLNLHYNFIASALTPFVSAGLGWTYIDTNIGSSPPTSSCWWDPWYGYICSTYQPTYSDWRYTYNAAVGLRWNLNRDTFMRLSVGKRWIDLPNSGDADFDTGRFELGFSYR